MARAAAPSTEVLETETAGLTRRSSTSSIGKRAFTFRMSRLSLSSALSILEQSLFRVASGTDAEARVCEVSGILGPGTALGMSPDQRDLSGFGNVFGSGRNCRSYQVVWCPTLAERSQLTRLGCWTGWSSTPWCWRRPESCRCSTAGLSLVRPSTPGVGGGQKGEVQQSRPLSQTGLQLPEVGGGQVGGRCHTEGHSHRPSLQLPEVGGGQDVHWGRPQ